MKERFYILAFICAIVVVSALTPVNTSKENGKVVTGIIKSISVGGVKDMVIELENVKITYYVNRGFENGFDIDSANQDYAGKSVTLYYADTWTPLAPFGTTSKHITQLSVDGTIIYSEW